MNDVVAHILIFAVLGVVALLLPLVIGYFVRPKLPNAEKDAAYECGEPTIGTSYVQFDLRFYVVALLFIIFDVEVAFFFPWASVYGGAMQLADTNIPAESPARGDLSHKLLNLPATAEAIPVAADAALKLGAVGMVDILVFFGVLLVGFAYVWKRGDLNWVRAVTSQASKLPANPVTPKVLEQEPRTRAVAS